MWRFWACPLGTSMCTLLSGLVGVANISNRNVLGQYQLGVWSSGMIFALHWLFNDCERSPVRSRVHPLLLVWVGCLGIHCSLPGKFSSASRMRLAVLSFCLASFRCSLAWSCTWFSFWCRDSCGCENQAKVVQRQVGPAPRPCLCPAAGFSRVSLAATAGSSLFAAAIERSTLPPRPGQSISVELPSVSSFTPKRGSLTTSDSLQIWN